MPFYVIEKLATVNILEREFIIKHKVRIDLRDSEITYAMPETLFSAFDVAIPPTSGVKIKVNMQNKKVNCSYTARVMPGNGSSMSALVVRREQYLLIIAKLC